MERTQIIRQILAFLDRAPIEGREAAAMILCQQWLKSAERANTGNIPTASSQVADTSDK